MKQSFLVLRGEYMAPSQTNVVVSIFTQAILILLTLEIIGLAVISPAPRCDEAETDVPDPITGAILSIS